MGASYVMIMTNVVVDVTCWRGFFAAPSKVFLTFFIGTCATLVLHLAESGNRGGRCTVAIACTPKLNLYRRLVHFGILLRCGSIGRWVESPWHGHASRARMHAHT